MIHPDTLRERFAAGQTFEAFRAAALDHREALQRLYETLSIPADLAQEFLALVQRHGGQLNVLALAEDWCGDAARALPLLARLVEAVPGVALRILPSEDPQNAPLVRNWPRGERNPIPILAFLDGEFQELGHWVERSQAGDAFLERKRAELKDLSEEEFFREFRPQMMAEFERRLWQDTLAEWRDVLKAAPDA